MGPKDRRLLEEVHQAIVGTPDGAVKGLRPRVEEIESFVSEEKDARKGRRLRSTVIEAARVVAASVSGFLGGKAS